MKFIKTMLGALLVVMLLFSLTACDFFGGEQADPTLYHLTLSYSDNVANNPSCKQEDLKATLAFYDDDYNVVSSYDEDEIQEYIKAGATQEDIDRKAAKRQSDGSYYFFDQDPMFLDAPQIEGYVFIGFYFKGTNNRALSPAETLLSDGAQRRPRWNMKNKNTELEARYQVLEYYIAYCYGFDKSSDAEGNRLPSGEMQSGHHSNPTQYNYSTNPNVTLTAPTDTFPGYEFEYWYYNKDGNHVKVETLPKVYDDDVLHGTITSNGVSDSQLTLFAHYKDVYVTPTIVVKDTNGQAITGLDSYITVTANDSSGSSIELAQKYVYGTKLGVRIDTDDLLTYELEGIYVDGTKIADVDLGEGLTRPSNVLEPLSLTHDVVIEIRLTAIPE